MSNKKAWIYLLAREVPDVLGEGMSLSSVVLGGEWINGRQDLYPAFATEFDAMAFKKSVDGALACQVLALEVAIDVPSMAGDVPEVDSPDVDDDGKVTEFSDGQG